MGAFTPTAQVWYPAITDTAEINTLMSTMASSIESGLGARMNAQEKLISCVLTVDTAVGGTTLPAGTGVTIPFRVDSFGYNTGDMTVSAGTVTVNTPGIYFISSTVTLNDMTSFYIHSVNIAGIERVRGFSFKPNGGAFQYSAQTSVVKLNAGDAISTVVQANTVAGSIRNISTAGNVMTVTLLKPL